MLLSYYLIKASTKLYSRNATTSSSAIRGDKGGRSAREERSRSNDSKEHKVYSSPSYSSEGKVNKIQPKKQEVKDINYLTRKVRKDILRSSTESITPSTRSKGPSRGSNLSRRGVSYESFNMNKDVLMSNAASVSTRSLKGSKDAGENKAKMVTITLSSKKRDHSMQEAEVSLSSPIASSSPSINNEVHHKDFEYLEIPKVVLKEKYF